MKWIESKQFLYVKRLIIRFIDIVEFYYFNSFYVPYVNYFIRSQNKSSYIDR